MIKVERILIQEFRGIRELTVVLKGRNFAICGPNGTGKSGIVDALEFALTGNISRLSGKGTGGLSVKEHGPHVDSRNRPDKARVKLDVFIPSLNITATIERTVKDASKPRILPNTPEVAVVFAQVEAHPEFVLSRREIIRYVLSEPGQRSKEVQALLRLEQVETLRASLQKIANASEKELTPLGRGRSQAQDALCRALGIAQLTAAKLLEAVNAKRVTLGLPAIQELTSTTSIKDGVATGAGTQPQRLSKVQATADLGALQALLDRLVSEAMQAARNAAHQSVTALSENPVIAEGVAREELLKSAIALFDEKECPVCATPWDSAKFKAVVSEKLKAFDEAAAERAAAEKLLLPLQEIASEIADSLALCIRHAKQLVPPVPTPALDNYLVAIRLSSKQFEDFLPLQQTASALETLSSVPADVVQSVVAVRAAVTALPEQSVQDAARDFLTVGQERLKAFRDASLQLKAGEERAALSKAVHETYVAVSTEALEEIYKTVQKQFGDFYRLINKDDESTFEARLTPSMARLAFDVDFYGRGFFPPGAYHSEGHQDGMGLCLYLALMKHILGDDFCFAVLDDVVMSVDSGHRREVCKLLKDQFPNTQFILTTHDEVWLRHMSAAGLVGAKSFIQFRRWDVSQGPIEWTDKDIWEEMAEYLKNNDVRSAAALLRHFLEYFSREVCDQIRARVEFRGDGRYELGGLMPAAVGRMRDLIKKGNAAANSWGDKARVAAIEALGAKFGAAVAATELESWQVNPAVHYNEWANFVKADFEPVVAAYKSLILEFRCAACSEVLYVSFDGFQLDALRCGCGKTNVNLKPKAAA